MVVLCSAAGAALPMLLNLSATHHACWLSPVPSGLYSEKRGICLVQGRALAAEMMKMQEEAHTAAEKLEALLRERDAERKQLLETQTALNDALHHLEAIGNEAEVLQTLCVTWAVTVSNDTRALDLTVTGAHTI